MQGSLIIDGESIAPQRLSRLADRAVRELAASGAGPGCGILLTEEDPLGIAVAALAAERLGAPVLCQGPLWRRLRPTRKVAAMVRADGTEGVRVTPVPEQGKPPFPEDAHTLLYTSGSSGEPKAVMLSRRAVEYHRGPVAEHIGIGRAERRLVPMSLLHSYGWGLLQMWLAHGFTLHVESRMSLDRVCLLLREGGFDAVEGVGSMYAALLAAARHDPALAAGLGRLRYRGCGGDVLPVALVQGYLDLVGAPIHDGYGLSETVALVSQSVPSSWRLGTCGPMIRGSRARIDPADNEIHLHGPGLMDGYLDDPAADRDVFTEDGWLRTGDRGELSPDGHLTVLGRIKESLIVHGETFPPRFVEDVLAECPGVEEAVAVGIPTGTARGDRVVAFCVAEEGAHDQVRSRMIEVTRASLPVHLRPQELHLVEALPRTRTDKPDRRLLRQRAAGRTVSPSPTA